MTGNAEATLVAVTVEALRARVRGLNADMTYWAGRTGARGDLPRHTSQVRRLRIFLQTCLAEAVRGTAVDLAVEPAGDVRVDDVPALRRTVGTVHLLWDFYRDKFAQRDMDDFAQHLGVADDLAWACYEPFLQAGIAAGAVPEPVGPKEPPLVFYATDRTPFAKARSKSLHPAGLDATDVAQFADALQLLPVPVIGLPWETANRMPETALVGHEAGHVVAEDLGLGAEAKQALAGLMLPGDEDGDRRTVWLKWCDEVFADVMGVLATGTAFVDSLTAELVAGRNDVRLAPINESSPGLYPTAMLRVALCGELLTHLGLEASAGWRAAYGSIDGDSAAYAADVPVIAATLLDRTWSAIGGKRLGEVLPRTADHERDAAQVAADMLDGATPQVAFDVRTWVAGATHARRIDPARYVRRDLDVRFAEALGQRRGDGVRGVEIRDDEPPTWLGTPPESNPERDARDRRAGVTLAAALGLTTSGPTEPETR